MKAQVWRLNAYPIDMTQTTDFRLETEDLPALREATNVEEINAMTAQLPIAQAGVMQFEIMPLLPYTGTAELFAQ